MLPESIVQVLTDATLLAFANLKHGLLEAFAFADVAYRTRHQHTFFGLKGTQADLDWKLSSVLV
jgi:hypothetical protein